MFEYNMILTLVSFKHCEKNTEFIHFLETKHIKSAQNMYKLCIKYEFEEIVARMSAVDNVF